MALQCRHHLLISAVCAVPSWIWALVFISMSLFTFLFFVSTCPNNWIWGLFLITLLLFSLCLYAIYPPHSQHPCCLPCQHKLRLSTTGHCTDNYEHSNYLTCLISSWKQCFLLFFFNPCWSRHPPQASKLALGKVWSCHSCCLTSTSGLPPFWMTSTSFDNLSHSTLRSDCRIVYQTRYLSWLASRLKRFKRVSMVTKYSLVKRSKERERDWS